MFVHIPTQQRKELEPTARRAIFVRYSKSNKLFRIYDPEKEKVETVRDIKFIEETPQKVSFLEERWTPPEKRGSPDQGYESVQEVIQTPVIQQDYVHEYEQDYDEEEDQPKLTSSYELIEPIAGQSTQDQEDIVRRRGPGRPKGAKNRQKPLPPRLGGGRK